MERNPIHKKTIGRDWRILDYANKQDKRRGRITKFRKVV